MITLNSKHFFGGLRVVGYGSHVGHRLPHLCDVLRDAIGLLLGYFLVRIEQGLIYVTPLVVPAIVLVLFEELAGCAA